MDRCLCSKMAQRGLEVVTVYFGAVVSSAEGRSGSRVRMDQCEFTATAAIPASLKNRKVSKYRKWLLLGSGHIVSIFSPLFWSIRYFRHLKRIKRRKEKKILRM